MDDRLVEAEAALALEMGMREGEADSAVGAVDDVGDVTFMEPRLTHGQDFVNGMIELFLLRVLNAKQFAT